MKRRPRDIGTAAETATVKYLAAHGFPHAERRSLRGALDAGDITGTPAVAWEVKGGDAARTASDLMIERWMAELAAEVTNAKADVGLLVVQRAGVGPANAGRWWAWMPAWQLADLTAKWEPTASTFAFPVRMLLADAVTLLRAAGYGDEPEPRPVVVPYQPGQVDDLEDIPLPGMEAACPSRYAAPTGAVVGCRQTGLHNVHSNLAAGGDRVAWMTGDLSEVA